MSLAWGGYSNGGIPASALHAVPNFSPLYSGVDATHASNLMMTEAAVQFSALAKAFYIHFKKPLLVSEAYRRLDRQQSLYALYKNGQGNLAAYPGTSNHGWGRSLDLASSVNINGSAENTWMRQNAPAYGFYFTVPSEAWHVDYLGSPSIRASNYIANPNAISTDSKPENHVPTEDEMKSVRLIRNTTKGDKNYGSIDAICVETGMWRHMPNQGYVDAWKKAYDITVEDMAANWWGYWKQMTTQTRNDARDAVWAAKISGYNGDPTAGSRLAGIDAKADDLDSAAIKKVVDALPKQSGATIDVTALAKALAPLVAANVAATVAKAVNDDAAKRMQS